MIAMTIPRFATTDLATINSTAPDIQIICFLRGGTYLLPGLMSISIIFYPFLNPINIPETNPNIAAIGSPVLELVPEREIDTGN
jgi:hypothetical protein